LDYIVVEVGYVEVLDERKANGCDEDTSKIQIEMMGETVIV